jgi:hypothetical protein
MKACLMKVLRDAWRSATGMYLTQLRAERKEIRTAIIKRALNRTFALQQLSHQHISEIARFRYMDKWLRIHTTRIEKLWNN